MCKCSVFLPFPFPFHILFRPFCSDVSIAYVCGVQCLLFPLYNVFKLYIPYTPVLSRSLFALCVLVIRSQILYVTNGALCVGV